MEDDLIEHESASLALNLIGIVACVTAMWAGGVFAVLAAGVGIACLVGSVAATLMATESPCERYLRESEEAGCEPAVEEPPIALGHQVEPGHRWRQAVAEGRRPGRSR